MAGWFDLVLLIIGVVGVNELLGRPWLDITKDSTGKNVIRIGDRCFNEAGAVVTCPPPTTTPPPATNNTVTDNFDGTPYVLAEGAISPNGKWRCVYTGYGICQVTSPGVMRIQPKVSTGTYDETHAPLVISNQQFTNFEWTFQMKTVQQLRQNMPPQNWETAWCMFRYTDETHHYYFVLKKSGIELGKKDNAPGNSDPEDQKYVSTLNYPALQLGVFYNIKIRMEGFHIQIWINNIKVIDVTDVSNNPTVMSKGAVGFYTEDAIGEYDNSVVTILP